MNRTDFIVYRVQIDVLFMERSKESVYNTNKCKKKQEYRHTIVFGFPTSKSIKIQLNLTNIY